jgi:hypothetical protein
MKNLKIRFGLAIFIILLACNKESNNEYPISGDVQIDSLKTGMTELKISVLINVLNIKSIESSGLYLYDESMNLIETRKFTVNNNGNYSYNIGSLERGKVYNVRFFLKDNLSNEISSDVITAKMKTFNITGIHHNNVLNHDLDPGWGEWNGVLSGDSIFISGSYLNEFDNNCKIYLDNFPDVLKIIKRTDNELTITIDSTVNYKIDFKTFYKECKIYVIEDIDTIGSVLKINVFPDKPVLEQCIVSSGGWIELGGGMGNNGLDSLYVNTIKCQASGYRTYSSRYYHQRWWQYYSINPALLPGSYTFIGYLNGYSDSIKIDIP